MRNLLALGTVFALLAPAGAAPLDAEARTGYLLRVVVRTGDHPTLTRHFRTEVLRGVTSALQAALGPAGAVEGIDLNDTPPDRRDPLWTLAEERGLDALDEVTAATGPKTHFVFIDFADGKYRIRTRQHDGNTGFVTPFVRTQVHGDRGFAARLAGLAVGQDFGVVGTFDPSGPQVNVVLKAGELGPLDQFVRTGDVFAVIQVLEGRQAVAPRGHSKKAATPPPAPGRTGRRIDGVLLRVVEPPRNGLAVCRVYNRYRGLPQRDGLTLGYRCVKLGTGEGPLRLRLTDPAGAPFGPDKVQARAGDTEFPNPQDPRARDELRFRDGVFVSEEKFRNVAFVLVQNGQTPVARIPVEIFPEHVATRKVHLNPAAEPSPAQWAATDLLDRIRSARVIQARCFEEVAALQKTAKPKALEYGQEAAAALEREADLLRADLDRAKERFKGDAPANLFEACEGDLLALETKTRELRTHLVQLKDVIRIENDPAAAALHKKIQAALLEAETAVKAFDIDQAIARYEEALKLAADEPMTRAAIEKALTDLRAAWQTKDAEHAAARKFVYDVWAKLAKPGEVRDALPEARRVIARLKAVGDRFTLGKMYSVAPQVVERYKKNLTELYESAADDEDRQTLTQYAKVSRDLEELLTGLGKELGK